MGVEVAIRSVTYNVYILKVDTDSNLEIGKTYDYE